MDKKGKQPKPPIGDFHNAEGLYQLSLNYYQALRINRYSEATVLHKEECIRRFLRWCDERDIQAPQQITQPIVELYKKHLYHYRKPNGKPLSGGTQRGLVNTINGFLRFLVKERIILFNPASEVEMPRQGFRLPKDILTEKEIELILSQPDTQSPFGIRDRAIMELLYSTGIRRLECSRLEVRHLDLNRETLLVRGKGDKDRIVPVGERALLWMTRYLEGVRPCHQWLRQEESAIFLTQYGKPLSASHLSDQVSRYMKQAKITKEGSSHLFRHSMATHMLENGADIRYIQAMLGHSDIGTTQIYTQVSVAQLKKVCQETHPAQQTMEPEAS